MQQTTNFNSIFCEFKTLFSGKTGKKPGVFQKFFPMEMSFFEIFKSCRREFSNGSFDRENFAEKNSSQENFMIK